jgi:endonuclease/exonuclease/phosphatase (EEP) superfamily protein YafD
VPRPGPPRPSDAWTVFGRWRRATPLGRGIGIGLLLLSLLLTVLWASDPRRVPATAAPGSATGAMAGVPMPPPEGRPPEGPPAEGPPAAASAAAASAADAPVCGADAPAGARALTLPLEGGAGDADPWAPWLGEIVCLTHPLVVAEVYELPSQRRLLAAVERPWSTTPADAYLRGTLHVRPAAGAARARLLSAVDAGPAEDASAEAEGWPGEDASAEAEGWPGEDASAEADGWPAEAAPAVAAAAPATATGSGAWGLGSGELRSGDALEGLHGRLRAVDGRVVLEAPALTVRRLNPRPPAPAPAGGPAGGASVRVAGFNLANWFVTLGDRGAATSVAHDRQAGKLVAALLALDADALALAEVENDDGSALDDLLRRLNEAQRAAGRDPAATYVAARAPPGAGGRDTIRVAIAYRPAALTLLRVDTDRAAIHDRAPLAAAFALPDGRPALTLVAAHHKAKGGCPTSGDVDRGSGCWDLRRDAQSQALLDFAGRLTRRADDPPVLIVGDLNAYRHEAPVRRFAEAGWRVLVDDMPPERAYSYVYFGRAGALDHAVAAPALAARVQAAAFWPINADEPPHTDAALPTPYRSSDHDPILVDLSWD